MSSNRKKTVIAFYATLLSVIVLAVASYAWMSLSSSPVVSDLSLNLVSDNALEIAPDVDGTPGEWGSILDLSDPSKNAAKLRPVAFSAEEFAFRIAQFGLDGRISETVPIRLADQTDQTARDTSAAADTEVLREYLFTYSFFLRTEATDCVVSLSNPQQRDSEHPEGLGTFLIGEPIWNAETKQHDEGGNGAQNAFRFGFLIQGNAVDPDTFVLYEPNADGGKGSDTQSIDGEGKPLEGSYKLIRQKSSSFTETDPVMVDSVQYQQGAFYSDDTSLFKLRAGEERRVTLFIWLEGQDADCTNAISEGKIFANLQFTALENTEDAPIFSE